MRSITVQPLSLEAFSPIGSYVDLVHPRGEHLGSPPLEFFRDSILQTLGEATNVAYSTCRVQPRAMVIDVLEYHTCTGEAILPLDNDVIVQVAPATHPSQPPPLDRLSAFRVPQGTMLCIRPGVWHHGPFALGQRPANILIALPERTYANDCVVVQLPPNDRVQISLTP